MPYRTEWVDPEVFIEHDGVSVYHLYDDDNIEGRRMTYWYSTSPDCSPDDPIGPGGPIDVREPSSFVDDSTEGHKAAFVAAIDTGEVRAASPAPA